MKQIQDLEMKLAKNIRQSYLLRMLSRYLIPLLLLLSINASAVIQPASNPFGSEENQYAHLWKNRAEIFSLCLTEEENCELVPAEREILLKMVAATKEWKNIRFFMPAEFAEKTKNLIGSVRVPFLAFSAKPDAIVFEQVQMNEQKNKFSYDRKLFLLVAIAAQNAGIAPADADSTIRKVVAAWLVRWLKLDLGPIKEGDVNILVQFGTYPGITIFDNVSKHDLLAYLKPHLRCNSLGVKATKLGPADWASHAKTEFTMAATVTGKVKVECVSGEAFPLSYSIDLPFKRSPLGWSLNPQQLKVHIASSK